MAPVYLGNYILVKEVNNKNFTKEQQDHVVLWVIFGAAWQGDFEAGFLVDKQVGPCMAGGGWFWVVDEFSVFGSCRVVSK